MLDFEDAGCSYSYRFLISNGVNTSEIRTLPNARLQHAYQGSGKVVTTFYNGQSCYQIVRLW